MLNTLRRPMPTALSLCMACALGAVPLGVFENSSSVTPGTLGGHADFNSFTGEYTVMSSGGEIGGKTDGFHYVWTRVKGDITLDADARFIAAGSGDSSQAALMIRQSLDPDAVYVAAMMYGNGQSAAQCRVDRGAASKSADLAVYSNMAGMVHLSIQRRGDSFKVAAGKMGKMGGPLPVSPPMMVTMNGPVYVGLAVAGLNEPEHRATAAFSNVSIQGATAE